MKQGGKGGTRACRHQSVALSHLLPGIRSLSSLRRPPHHPTHHALHPGNAPLQKNVDSQGWAPLRWPARGL